MDRYRRWHLCSPSASSPEISACKPRTVFSEVRCTGQWAVRGDVARTARCSAYSSENSVLGLACGYLGKEDVLGCGDLQMPTSIPVPTGWYLHITLLRGLDRRRSPAQGALPFGRWSFSMRERHQQGVPEEAGIGIPGSDVLDSRQRNVAWICRSAIAHDPCPFQDTTGTLDC